MNHPVNVRSTPGKGSCFSIEMSASRAKADEADRPKLPVAKDYAILGGTVLVIEDDTFVRLGLESRLLKSAGLGCSFRCKWQCCSGSRLTKKNIRPDLVLSDLNLQGPMNGVESISALRAALASEIPAVVLTGDVIGLETITNQNIEIATKPLDGDQLIQLINQLMPVAKSENGRLVKSLLEH